VAETAKSGGMGSAGETGSTAPGSASCLSFCLTGSQSSYSPLRKPPERWESAGPSSMSSWQPRSCRPSASVAAGGCRKRAHRVRAPPDVHPGLRESPLRLGLIERMFSSMVWVSRFTDARLDSLYDSEGFRGDQTMRAKVIRELIDEIRGLRGQLTKEEVRPEGSEPQ
jgi:hypothetical protein